MSINKKIAVRAVAIVGAAAIAITPIAVHAALTADSKLTQVVSDGVLSTDILDNTGADVASPAFAMTGATVSNLQQTATGTFGSNTQRITVDNPGGADNGWVLSLNATVPGTGVWTSGGDDYPYNDTAPNGRLTVNPAAGTLTPVVGGSTGLTLGTSSSFSGTNPITLITAASGSTDIWNGYVTGIGLSQTIPASQPAGSYMLDMTQTVVAS